MGKPEQQPRQGQDRPERKDEDKKTQGAMNQPGRQDDRRGADAHGQVDAKAQGQRQGETEDTRRDESAQRHGPQTQTNAAQGGQRQDTQGKDNQRQDNQQQQRQQQQKH
jgi:hypothetical protein